MQQLKSLAEILASAGFGREAEALSDVYGLSILSTEFGGLGYKPDSQLVQKEEAEVLFLVSAWLESLNSADRSKAPAKHLSSRPDGRRPMTLSEKIFAAHDIDRKGAVKPGDVVRVNVDWIMASELSWRVRIVHANVNSSLNVRYREWKVRTTLLESQGSFAMTDFG